MPAMTVLGDRTDHGGEVVEASGVTDTHGKKIARVGDKVVFPKKGHGTTEIVTGDFTMLIDGKAVAYHCCRTSCGATLISSQMVTSVEFGGRGAASDVDLGASRVAAGAAARALAEGHLYDEQSLLVASSIQGVPYYIETQDGRKFSGPAGADGLLPRIGTASEAEYTVRWGDEALAREHEVAA